MQDGVTRDVPVPVVDLREVVEVDEQDGDRLAALDGVVMDLRCSQVPPPPIGKPRETISAAGIDWLRTVKGGFGPR